MFMEPYGMDPEYSEAQLAAGAGAPPSPPIELIDQAREGRTGNVNWYANAHKSSFLHV